MRSSVKSGRFAISSAVLFPRARFVLINSLMMRIVPAGLFFGVGKPSIDGNVEFALKQESRG